jgi:hypothetical protein
LAHAERARLNVEMLGIDQRASVRASNCSLRLVDGFTPLEFYGGDEFVEDQREREALMADSTDA